MTQYSAFGVNGNAATGPGASIGFAGAFVAGLAFKVTTSGNFLYGYYLWRADSAQSGSASFALWQITGATTATLVGSSSASITGMTAGAWNYVALGTPLALTSGTSYKAVYGLTGNFCDTQDQFGNLTDPYAAGIVNGPLTVFSEIVGVGGSNPEPNGAVQGSFGTAGSDPAVNYPTSDDHYSNFWVDVLVGPSSGITATGSAAVAPMGLSGTATVSSPGGSATLPPMAMSGTAVQKNTASGALALPALAMSGGHTSWRLMDGVSGRPGTGSSVMTPPASPTAHTGSVQVGAAFAVSQPGMWFEGYWWYVPTGGDVGAQKFCLYSLGGSQVNAQDPVLIPAATVTSGTLTAGGWNWIPLTDPLPLSPGRITAAFGGGGGVYIATTAWTAVHGFPETAAAFGSGDPYANGIVNGPLETMGYFGGTRPPATYGPAAGQTVGTSTSDPATNCPVANGGDDNFWIDIQVGTPGPAGYPGTWRLYPNRADANDATTNDSAFNYVVATEIALSQPCTTTAIWYYSPDGTSQLATRASVYTITGADSGAEVIAVTSPSWKAPDGSAATAGGGWVYCAAGGVTLPAGKYKAAVWNDAATPDGWSAKDASSAYWDTGEGSAGVGSGPISAPGLATASAAYEYNGNAGGTPPYSNGVTEPGQCTFAMNGPAYPYLYVDSLAQNYWVDLEVTLPASGSAAAAALGMSGTVSAVASTATAGSLGVPGLHLTGTAAGTSTASGSMALPAMGLAAAVTGSTTGSGSLALPAMTEAGTGTQALAGSAAGSAALPALGMAGTAQSFSCSGSLAIPVLGTDGAAAQVITATGTLAVPALGTHGTATEVPPGSSAGSLGLAPLTLAGTAKQAIPSSGSAAIPAPGIAGTAGVQAFAVTGRTGIPAIGMAASGTIVQPPVAGAGSLTMPRMLLAGVVPPPFTVATLTASDTSLAVLTASDAPLATLTASDGTGGPR